MARISRKRGNAAGRRRGWWVAVGAVALMLMGGAPAAARAGLAPGGLVDLPSAAVGSTDFIQNGGFETVEGDQPAGWSAKPASAWKLDVGYTGSHSYRFSNASGPEASQEHMLVPGTYKLSAWMRTAGKNNSGEARLRFDFRPGGINDWKHTQGIGGTTNWTLYELTVVVPSAYANASGLVKVHVMLDGYWARPGLTAWYDDVKLERQNTLPLDVFMHYPNYRGTLFAEPAKQDVQFRVAIKHTEALADPTQYVVVSRIAAAAGALVEKLQHPLAGSPTPLQTDPATGEKYLLVSLNRAVDGTRPISADGSYLVTFALASAGTGEDVTGLPAFPPYRVNKVPTALGAGRIAFNEQNQVMIAGEPRFVLGVYDSAINYSDNDAAWESTLWEPSGDRRMDGLRINMYLNYHFGDAPAQAMNALMDNLWKPELGRTVLYLQTGNCFAGHAGKNHVGPDGTGFEIDIATPHYIVGGGTPESPDGLGIAPRAGGYYVADECEPHLVPEVFKQYKMGLVAPDTGLQWLDPDSMTFAALFGNNDLVLWRDAVDVMSTDPYPLYGPEPAGGYPHIRVAEWTAMTRTAVQGARPFFTVLQFFKFDAGKRQGRWPTFKEMRDHAYMAIAEGSRGLFWWSLGENGLANACRGGGWCADRTAYMQNLKTLVGELADLETVLLADDAPAKLAGNSSTAIRTKVKFVGGVGYIIAYNSTNTDNVTTTFTWSGGASTVEVDGQPLAVASNGTFTDTFGKYEARVYKVIPVN